MQTEATKRFDNDYLVLRKLLVRGNYAPSEKKMLLDWIKQRGNETGEAAEQEIQLSPAIRSLLANQHYDKDFLEWLNIGEEDE